MKIVQQVNGTKRKSGQGQCSICMRPDQEITNGRCADQKDCETIAEPLFQPGGSSPASGWRPFGVSYDDLPADKNGVRWVALGKAKGERKPGKRLVDTASWLLFAVMGGLLAVSYAAQYHYVLAERHQTIATAIEAGALDVLLLIFSLLALGLAMIGKSAKTERILICACAAGSALMNYAASDVSNWRSVLAYVMPPIALAVVADRCIAAYRRHVLADAEVSAWRDAARGMARTVLYVLRLFLAFRETVRGMRLWVLAATPLPVVQGEKRQAIIIPAAKPVTKGRQINAARRPKAIAGPGKGAQLLKLYGDLKASEDPRISGSVSAIAKDLGAEVGMSAGSARNVLSSHIRETQS
jgi:hypothetical protein